MCTKRWSELRAEALSQYTISRHPDAVAINDLALRNYQEMRSDVRSPVYLIRKYMEERLYAYAPSFGWATQYSRVSFENQRYSEVERLAQKQSRALLTTISVIGTSLFSTGCWWLWRWNQPLPQLKGLVKALMKLVARGE